MFNCLPGNTGQYKVAGKMRISINRSFAKMFWVDIFQAAERGGGEGGGFTYVEMCLHYFCVYIFPW